MTEEGAKRCLGNAARGRCRNNAEEGFLTCAFHRDQEQPETEGVTVVPGSTSPTMASSQKRRYLSAKYPTHYIVVRGRDREDRTVKPLYAQFNNHYFATDDPEIIEFLDDYIAGRNLHEGHRAPPEDLAVA